MGMRPEIESLKKYIAKLQSELKKQEIKNTIASILVEKIAKCHQGGENYGLVLTGDSGSIVEISIVKTRISD